MHEVGYGTSGTAKNGSSRTIADLEPGGQLCPIYETEEEHRLVVTAQQRQAEMSALLASSRAVLEYREFKDTARFIFDACKSSVGATAGYVVLLTANGTENEVLFLESGGRPCAVDPNLPMSIRGLRGEAYRTGRTVYDNSFVESEWGQYLPPGHVSLDNVLFAPLMIEGKTVGLLGLANKPGGFTENDARLASAFGELAAIALRNSRILESLEHSAAHFRSVVETATDAIISVDRYGNIVFWNRAAEIMFGHSADEVPGELLTIMPERFREAHQRGIQRVVSTGSSKIIGRTVELVGLRKDGREFPIELSLATWKAGEETFFTAIVRDVTERKRIEDQLGRHRDHLQELVEERTVELQRVNEQLRGEIVERRQVEEELRRVNRALKTLSDCNQALFSATEELELLYDICRIIVDVGGYRLAWVGFAEQDEKKTVRPVAQSGYEEGYLDTVNITWADTEWGRGPTGTAIRTGEPSICQNMLTDPDYAPWRAEAIKRGYASSVALPLTVDDRAFGALNMYAVEPDAFDPEEVNLLAELADNLAYGIMVLRARAERKRAEEALKRSEGRYRSLFEGVPVGLYRTTLEGQILDVNPALAQMLKYPDWKSLQGVNVIDLYVNPEKHRRWQEQVESGGIVHDAEVQLRCRDGTVIWVRNTARASRNADHRVVYYEGYVEDITERKEAQAAMIQAEKLAVAGKLAASLTHEINNPLQSVIGCLGLAEETLAEGGDASEYVQVAREELRRAARVVAQLRDLHRRPQVGEGEYVDLNALLEQVLVLSRKQCEDRGVEVIWTGADVPPLLLAADQMQQVFLNLLLNALDAMPEGGRLQVSTSRTGQPAGARIVFIDTGIGITPDILPHIFEPFYSTKSEGLGLGLFITENIVREHGGHIEVQSQVGKGTTFTVWLPA